MPLRSSTVFFSVVVIFFAQRLLWFVVKVLVHGCPLPNTHAEQHHVRFVEALRTLVIDYPFAPAVEDLVLQLHERDMLTES